VEFGLAVLSFGGSRLTDQRALKLIAWSCIAFHGSSGVLEMYAYAQGVSVAIVGNVAARAIIVALFVYLSRDRAWPGNSSSLPPTLSPVVHVEIRHEAVRNLSSGGPLSHQ
jgi:hypothetical protein